MKAEKALRVNRIINDLKKFASENSITWKDSFFRWGMKKDFDFDFSTSLPITLSHQKGIKIEDGSNLVLKSIGNKLLDDLSWSISDKGYINFCFSEDFFCDLLHNIFDSSGDALRGEKKGISINIEYVSANPTGDLHLAHLRQAFIGNSLSNIYNFLGYDVTREYYINDRGEQINNLISSVNFYYNKILDAVIIPEKDISYPGKSSERIAKLLVEKWKNKYLKKKLNNADTLVWKNEILSIVIDKIRSDLKKLGINFDIWFSEESLYKEEKHLKMIEKLKEKGLIYLENGALFFRSGEWGDDKDRVIVKENGQFTYFFSDMLYHSEKLSRSDSLIVIMGADHHGYISRLKSFCELLENKGDKISLVIVQTLSLLTSDGDKRKFSKRLGNSITLDDILQVSEVDQLKFLLLEKESNQPISLNIELLEKNQEKTRLYYIQYAYARSFQIIKKAHEKNFLVTKNKTDLLRDNKEKKIKNLIARFRFVLDNCSEERKHHYLLHYLFELSSAWQNYYQNELILNEENKRLSSQRIFLVKNVQIILGIGLDLLGLEKPKRI